MDIRKHCPEKVVSAEEAVANIRNGSRVFIGSGCGEPQHLIRAMVNDPNIEDIMIYQMFAFTLSNYLNDDLFLKRFYLKLFFISSLMRKAAFEGKIDYIPAYLSEIPDLFNSNQIGIDVALVQISPPDRFGFGSLGVSVDVTKPAIQNARTVIAQVNPRMPRTYGDGIVHVDDIDYLVPHEEPLVETGAPVPDANVARRIALFVSELIDDGSTLQVGFGALPQFVLQHLCGKNDLGLHTQLITDEFVPLFEQGVITNKRKNFLPDRAVATLCMGSRRVYEYIDGNPIFYFRSSDFVNDPAVVARNDNFISFSSALEVDLTGQVCSDSVGQLFYSGTGDQANFIRGAAMSKGGFSIVALPSTAKRGRLSRIVANLSEGAGVGTLRGDVNFVVTEYGIAQLRGKSISQRVMELAQIAHPKFRESLIEAAKENHYIFSDQLAPHPDDLLFTEGYKSRIVLKNGRTMSVRPLLPSDEIAYRNFFYSLREESIYFRFFKRIKVFSHKMAQEHWANLDYRKNVSLVGLVRNKGTHQMMAIATYLEAEDNRAEVALVVGEPYQGMGVATYLVKRLEEIAKENGYKGFCAYVMSENRPMIQVLRKLYPNAARVPEEKNIFFTMDFSDAAPSA